VSAIPAKLRKAVIERAFNRCEYCLLSQVGQEAVFHIDHVKPLAASGETVLENLALACVSCSLRKSSRESAADPATGLETRLFSPISDSWNDHFAWLDVVVVPLTDVGRTTLNALAMNRPIILAIRAEEALRGRHPPE
jgi:hypothetical protein